MKKETRLFVADFETTSYEGQQDTEVWSAAIVELFTPTDYDSVAVLTSLPDFFNYLVSLKANCIIWFHNLKFDGSFIVDYLLRSGYKWVDVKDKQMQSYQFKTLISDMQRWYNLKVCMNGRIFNFKDSAKLAPLSVKACGESFKTKFRKLTMEYRGKRYAGCEITDDEMRYIKNDVLVMKEVMEQFLEEGHDSLTIGSCCLKEYKKFFMDWSSGQDGLWDIYFPDLKLYTSFDHEYFKATNAFEFVYRFYHGAWCYKKEGIRYVDEPGIVVDKVSMYPSHMDSKVHYNKFAVGKPTFFKGEIPAGMYDKWANGDDKWVYMVRFKCKFRLKPGYFPNVQIKHSLLYIPTKWRESSDFDYGEKRVQKVLLDGYEVDARPTLHLSEVAFRLFMESYDVEDMEFLGGVYFQAAYGIFDDYVEYYREKKETSTGGKRTIYKLFSNNLYGKLASGDNSSYLIPFLNPEKDRVDFKLVTEHQKDTFAIQAGLLVTDYGRDDIIRAANADYERFLYSDTDSEHLLGIDPPNLPIAKDTYGYYKVEGIFRRGLYLRQKTYAEQIIKATTSGLCGEIREETWEWELTVAGMPKRCKEIFLNGFNPVTDMKEGTTVPGKLIPKRIKGGTILEETFYTFHEK